MIALQEGKLHFPSSFFYGEEYARKTRDRRSAQTAGHPRRTQDQTPSGRRGGYPLFPHRMDRRGGIQGNVRARGRVRGIPHAFGHCRPRRGGAPARQGGGSLPRRRARAGRGQVLHCGYRRLYCRYRGGKTSGHDRRRDERAHRRVRLRDGEREVLFPAAEGVIEAVDVENKVITVNEARFLQVAVEQSR